MERKVIYRWYCNQFLRVKWGTAECSFLLMMVLDMGGHVIHIVKCVHK